MRARQPYSPHATFRRYAAGWWGAVLLLGLATGIAVAEEPVGTLGGVALGREEMRAALRGLSAAQIASLRQDPALLEQVARTTLVQKLVLQEAVEKKWHEEPGVAARVRRAQDSAITESYLEALAEPPADYPAEEEVKKAYEAARPSLAVPRSFRLAQIFIATAPDAESRVAEVERLLGVANADFSAIAAAHSQDLASAPHGGEIGWLAEDQIQKELLPVIAGLKLFGLSRPVKLQDGWHILKLLDSRAPHTPTLEQARPQIVKRLRQEKLRASSQAYLAGLLRKHPLKINSTVLLDVLASEPSAASRP